MFKTLLAGSILAGAALLATVPSASAATEALVSRGTYPSQSAANKACSDGKARGEWDRCAFRVANPDTGTIQLLTNR